MTNKEMLDYNYKFPDCKAKSLREYFHTLLYTLWCEGEEFSGKRPFGNSGWDYAIYSALVDMGAVAGEWDKDEDTGERWGLRTFDETEANRLVPKLIKEMCGV